MSEILYGNLSAEVVSSLGVRIERVTLRQAGPDAFQRQHPDALSRPPIAGRDQQVADALRAIRQGLPIGFHAACGYGKTTLLQEIVARASQESPARSSIYLQADQDRVADLLQRLVAVLYRADRPVKLTAGQCAQLLGQVSAVIAVDDIAAGPDQVGYLLDVLSGCSVVIGSGRPVLGRRGTSQDLPGLPDDSALALLAGDLGRPLASQEVPAARRLLAAVDGQPLHVRQAAALVREGTHSIASLADKAARDPDILDALSISALAEHERRALAILALAGGVLLPASIVDAVGQIAGLGKCLQSLHRRGLAEKRDDRFGLPICKAGRYRQALLDDLHLAASVRELSGWLTTRNPTATEAQSGADAALAIVEFAAERGDWSTVAELARAAEPVLFLAGRWEAWHHILGRGLDAASASADRAAAAFFSHQLGSLALCQDRLDEAVRLLRHALAIREQTGDRHGADLTRHNLELLEPADLPPPDEHRPRRREARRRIALALVSILGALALVSGSVAIAGALRAGGRGHPAPSLGPSSGISTSQTSSQSTGPSQTTGSSQSSGTGDFAQVPNLIGQTQSEAISTLQRQGLTPSASTTGDCAAKDSGDVVSQDPAPGTSVPLNSSVAFSTCSPATSVVDVLDVVGQTDKQAMSTLHAQGLTVTSAGVSDCGAGENNDVVSQSPVAGTAVPAGSSVSIAVCIATG